MNQVRVYSSQLKAVNYRNRQLYVLASLLFLFVYQASAERIAVSIEPMEIILQDLQIPASEVEVISSVHQDIHTSELVFSDYLKFSRSGLIVLNGQEFEPWAGKIMINYSGKTYEFFRNCEPGVSATANNECGDPHLWLDPPATIKAAEAFLNFYCSRNKIDCSSLLANFNRWKEQVIAVHESYAQKFNDSANKTFISTHKGFGALARRYQLTAYHLDSGCETNDGIYSKAVMIHQLLRQSKITKILCDSEESKLGQRAIGDNYLECINSDPFAEEAAEHAGSYHGYADFLEQNLKAVLRAL